jgi:hypothetical protein
MVAIDLFSREQTTPPTVTLAVWVGLVALASPMIASSQRVRILPLCTDSEGRLSRSGHEVGQLHILLDGMLSMQPLPRINLHIQGPSGNTTSGLGSPNNSDRLFQEIVWARLITLARIESGLS